MSTIVPPQSQEHKPVRAIQYHAHVVEDSGPYHLTFSTANPHVSKENLNEIRTFNKDSIDNGVVLSTALDEWLSYLQLEFEDQVLAEVTTRKGSPLICAICKRAAPKLAHKIRFVGVFEKDGELQPSVFDKVAPWCGEEAKGCKVALEKIVRAKVSAEGRQ